MRYSFYSIGQILQNVLVLSATVLMLYLLGDVTENLQQWIGSDHSITIKFANFLFDLTDLYVKLIPFVVAMSCFFAWVRSAANGELTAIEAAGYHPAIHWTGPGIFILLASAAVVWYDYAGQHQLEQARQAVDRARDGKIMLQSHQEVLRIDDQSLWVYKNGSPQYMIQSRSNFAKREPQAVFEYTQVLDSAGNIALHGVRYDIRANELTAVASFVPPERTNQISANQIAENFVPDTVFRLLLVLVLCGIGFRVIVRHGRQSGLANQIIKGVVLIAVAWVLLMAVMYSIQLPFLRSVVCLGIEALMLLLMYYHRALPRLARIL